MNPEKMKETPAIEAVQGSVTESVEKALAAMKSLAKEYEETTASGDSKKLTDLNLYEYPKVVEMIRQVEKENLEKGGADAFVFEMTPECKRLENLGLGFDKRVIERQRQLVLQEKDLREEGK